MSDDNSYEILIRLDQRVGDMHEQLLGSTGRIPKVESQVDEHSAQIHQWTGSLKLGAWVVGVLLTLFGGLLVTHLMTPEHTSIVVPASQPTHHTPTTPSLTP